MKRLLYLFVFTLCAFHLAPSALAAEAINAFNVSAKLGSDRSLVITETIEYDFGNSSRRGIFRLIPERYQRSGGAYRLNLQFLGATMDGGSVESSLSHEDGNLRIRLGSEDVYITGKHVYTISYRTDRAINDFPEEGVRELYWNVTGNGWEVPIKSASFDLEGPGEPSDLVCFTGYFGNPEQACEIVAAGSSIQAAALRALSSGEGLTVAIRFPESVISPLSTSDRVWQFIQDNLWLFIPVLVFAIMYAIWWTHGRDPRGRGTVIPHYEEPSALSPMEMSALLDQSISSKAVTAAILDIARRGYAVLVFEGDQTGGWFKKKGKMILKKVKDADNGLKKFERTLYNGLFEDGDEVDISERNEGFYAELQRAREQVFEGLKEKKLFLRLPASIRTIWMVVAIIVAAFLFIFTIDLGELNMISSVLSGLIIGGFGWFMPKLTQAGAVLREEIEGFKRFLSVTETQRLAFTDAPEKKPEQFARFLPAAVAFGVENQWAGQFANMMLPAPSYMTGSVNGWNAANFANAADSFHSTTSSSMYAAPSSGGSGGSGFSGGGSGGGFGGGGGGSW
ncbi:DUF2207 domain-containing protein [Candidatus Uhrbacteria bacterium]|nr:DUF2207 domain-containing protein [Candidatus Uhrbacteria bacterium]